VDCNHNLEVRLYRTILGTKFERLAPVLQEFHDKANSAEGVFTVTHDPRILSKILVRVMRLPRAGTNLPLKLEVTTESGSETWIRQLGVSKLVSHQSEHEGYLIERTGPLKFRFKVSESNGGMDFVQDGCSILGIELPQALSPIVNAKITPNSGGWHVIVAISIFRLGTICQYDGEAHIP
jgi:hypothetical protein